jgi:signal transduction histidine kinase
MLFEFIETHREEIVTRCRAKVATRSFPEPTAAEIDHGVPLFLDQLIEVLRRGERSDPAIGESASRHGHDLLAKGFTVSQVVHDYGDVCQSITELAMETHAPISPSDFNTLNRCLDDAIAAAVTQFGHEREVMNAADRPSTLATQRFGFFTHEARNLVNTAIVSFEVLKTGNVGVSGSTGSVLDRSLSGLRSLIAGSLAELRLTEGILNPTSIQVAAFVDEVAAAARLEADTRGVHLTVMPVQPELVIEGDRQVLALVLGNLLQNAFKFTRPQTTVTLRVNGTTERIRIEIEDECGGFPGGDINQLFKPFEQRSADRSGLGLGLAFSRWGVEANNGRIYTRNIPNRGCVFTVDLPRLLVTDGAVAMAESR